jgi:hypothetical protein
VTQVVQGRLTVSEPSTTYPNPAADAARKDGSAWLDNVGQIQIFEVGEVLKSTVPGWKSKGWGVRWVIPIWVYLAGAGGVLLLGVLFLLIWLLLARRRRQKTQLDQYDGEADHIPSTQQPWVPNNTSTKRHNRNGWWQDGQVSTPPGSRGATEDRPMGSSNRTPRSSRGPKGSRWQQRVREEGHLQRHQGWDEEPPDLPGAYR